MSREDGYETSKSIESQIQSLNNYAKDNNIKIQEIFIDDGYSGATLERPGFKRLLNDIQLKKINCILIKDLSRLGRNFIQVGNLLEVTFPKNNIRLISVNDNYDSSSNIDDESILLKNFLNDYYLKECGRKQRKAKQQQAKKDNMSSTGLYGYIKDENKNLAIDEQASKVVKEIFNMYEKNISTSQIAKHLSNKNIPTPAYTKILNSNTNCYNITEEQKYNWNSRSVLYILSVYDYTGNSVNLKTKSIKGRSFKNDKPIIIENTHPAIISTTQFNKTKNIRESKKKKLLNGHLDSLRIKSLFKCECGKVLLFNGTKKISYYRCKKCHQCFNADVLHEALSLDIKNLVNSYNLNNKQFEIKLKDALTNTNELNDIKELEKEKNYIQTQIEILFEKKFEGEIQVEEYQTKNEELKETLNLINAQLSKYDKQSLDMKMFDNRFNKLVNEIKQSVSITNNLDLIRHFIKECTLLKEDGVIKLKPKYKCGIKTS